MKLTDNALRILRTRYLLRDDKGVPKEDAEGMLRRVAAAVAAAEAEYGSSPSDWAEKFYRIMNDLNFLPNSPTLMNAGKPRGQIAACFVLPVEDSMSGIFETLKNAALILQSGGGTGFSFSRLRPAADPVSTTGGIASGPVSFMKIYNTATDVIKQGGARRGANMGILRVDHPDILDFIHVKSEGASLDNFNISVAITDAFMEALEKDTEYSLLNPRTGATVSRLRAATVFGELAKSAWLTGDPGVIFIDRINAMNPTPHIGMIESTNPCGEQPLLPYEACVLGSLDLSKFTGANNESRGIDYARLEEVISIAVRFLDDCIDINTYPLPEIAAMHKGNRKIGLGLMGWADTLVDLGIPYDSPLALALAEEVMEFLRSSALRASEALALERGVFPNFKGSVYDAPGKPRPRNATVTTLAPTGSLSILADCSSGIEPLFALANVRRILDDEFIEVNRRFFLMARQKGFYTPELEAEVMRKGMLRGLKSVPPEVKRLFKTAHEIKPEMHIRMQAAFQRHTDNAVSKTINLPEHTRPEDVARAFRLAYELGVKGITVFRHRAKKPGTLFYNVTEKTNTPEGA